MAARPGRFGIALAMAVMAQPALACDPSELPIQFRQDDLAIGLYPGACGDSGPPPACLAGADGLVVEVTAPANAGDGADEVLGRAAAISHYPTIRYWSDTRGRWRELITEAYPLESAEGGRLAAADLDALALAGGRPAFVFLAENSPAGDIAYKMTARRPDPDRLELEAVNARPVRFLGFTVFAPGEYAFHHGLTRRPDRSGWDYHGSLTAAGCGNPLIRDKAVSFATRMAAIAGYLLGRTISTPPERMR